MFSSDKKVKDRKLYQLPEFSVNNSYATELEHTNDSLSELNIHKHRNTEMKQIVNWFSNIQEQLDDFRDGVHRKINELHMGLQRP